MSKYDVEQQVEEFYSEDFLEALADELLGRYESGICVSSEDVYEQCVVLPISTIKTTAVYEMEAVVLEEVSLEWLWDTIIDTEVVTESFRVEHRGGRIYG